MKKVALFLIPFVLLIADDKKKTPAPAAAPKIPAEAKQIEPYLYRYTDPRGKNWLYRETPFGVVKLEDKPAAPAPATANTEPVRITDLGDTVQFRWKTPFGEQKVTRKKSELTDDEKAMLQRDKDQRSAPEAHPASEAQTKRSEKQL